MKGGEEGMRKKSVLRTPAHPSCGQAHKQCSHAGTPSSSQPSSLPACLPLRHNEPLTRLPHNRPSLGLHRRCSWVPCPSTPTEQPFLVAGPVGPHPAPHQHRDIAACSPSPPISPLQGPPSAQAGTSTGPSLALPSRSMTAGGLSGSSPRSLQKKEHIP